MAAFSREAAALPRDLYFGLGRSDASTQQAAAGTERGPVWLRRSAREDLPVLAGVWLNPVLGRRLCTPSDRDPGIDRDDRWAAPFDVVVDAHPRGRRQHASGARDGRTSQHRPVKDQCGLGELLAHGERGAARRGIRHLPFVRGGMAPRRCRGTSPEHHRSR
jgi:hypothetical protein